ncbi:MAG: AraC family transcriptional regulator [bacterium]
METPPLAAPVEALSLVDELIRTQAVRYQAETLPGHLIQVITAGACRQFSEGRSDMLREGTVIWCHENEPVEGEILTVPWRLITINFLAPKLSPPPEEDRVLQVDVATLRLAKRLLLLWRSHEGPPLKRQLDCHRTLIELIQRLSTFMTLATHPEHDANIWWRVEKKLRLQLEQSHSIASMCRSFGLSEHTLCRACHAATGLPPMKRLKNLRLGYAHGLVQHSELPMTEIAFRVGYARPQEFSRDYRLAFGVTPHEDRKQTPSYKNINAPAVIPRTKKSV